MKKFVFAFVGTLAFIALSCEASSSQETTTLTNERSTQAVIDSQLIPFPYDLQQPEKTITLPPELVEVSGLSYVDEQTLAMVQDEKGFVFHLDLVSDSIRNRIRFGKSGDYEGIEVIGDTTYVVKSNGKIYRIANLDQAEPSVTKYETPLSEEEDVEGLGYLSAQGKLLLVCKEPIVINGREVEEQRSVFAFDLKQKRLLPQVFFPIHLLDIKQYMTQTATTEAEKNRAADFNPDKKSAFKPSGIAQHPQSGHFYVIASNGKLMVVLNKSYQVVQVQPLSKEIFTQPEGIAFSPSGTLYISNEGKGGSGTVLVFPAQVHNR
ncbi:MAG: SdiA-regulated domain-containing protein [Bacteroidota bacterium]